MKAEELKVGDLLTFKDCVGDSGFPILKVNGILPDTLFVQIDYSDADDEVDYEDIIGITLTPEILEKNGFVKSKVYEVWKIICDDYELRVTPWRVAVIFLDEDGSDKEEFSAPRPKYVHELQHALRLCGIEKEIVI